MSKTTEAREQQSSIRWTKDKKIALSMALAFLLVTSPLWGWVASNVGAGILSLLLDREPTRSELIGDYTYTAKWGTAALHLSPDGTLKESVNEHASQSKQYAGSWGAATEDNSAKVTFRPFGMVGDDNHGSETDVFAMNFYKRRLGQTYATIDDDLGEQFEQQ